MEPKKSKRSIIYKQFNINHIWRIHSRLHSIRNEVFEAVGNRNKSRENYLRQIHAHLIDIVLGAILYIPFDKDVDEFIQILMNDFDKYNNTYKWNVTYDILDRFTLVLDKHIPYLLHIKKLQNIFSVSNSILKYSKSPLKKELTEILGNLTKNSILPLYQSILPTNVANLIANRAGTPRLEREVVSYFTKPVNNRNLCVLREILGNNLSQISCNKCRSPVQISRPRSTQQCKLRPRRPNPKRRVPKSTKK